MKCPYFPLKSLIRPVSSIRPSRGSVETPHRSISKVVRDYEIFLDYPSDSAWMAGQIDACSSDFKKRDSDRPENRRSDNLFRGVTRPDTSEGVFTNINRRALDAPAYGNGKSEILRERGKYRASNSYVKRDTCKARAGSWIPDRDKKVSEERARIVRYKAIKKRFRV